MKKTQLIYFAILALLGASCNKVVDKTPQDAITDLNFWTSVDNLKLYANNFYNVLYIPTSTVDDSTDNTVPTTPNSWLYGDAVVPSRNGGWDNSDWANIRNANYFLSHYQQVVDNPTTINQYVGEIKFFRAYEYFKKVKYFGDVPWINKDLNVDDTAYLYAKRTPRQTVIDSVIADLNFAVANLPVPSSAERGRLHKYAALQMLARVNLYQGTWMKYRNISGWEVYLNNAVAASSQIMQSGLYSIPKPTALYYFKTGNLVDAKTGTYATMDYPLYYREQFITEDLTTNPECVMPKIFIVNILASNLSKNGQSGMGASKDLIEDFLCDDGLPIRLSSRYKGDDSSTLEFQNRDPRLRNIMDNRFLPNYLNGTNPTSNYLSPVTSAVPTGYQIFKYKSPIPQQNEANQCTYDMYIFRYAEVLLINAEALAELGTITQTDIDNTINKLRARLDEPSLPGGQMGRLTMNPPADPNATTLAGAPRYGYNVSPLIYEIRRERRIEMAFDGMRWDDIVRWHAGALINNPKTVYGMVASQSVINRYNSYFNTTPPDPAFNYFGGINLITITDWDGKTKQIVSPYTRAMRVWNDKLYLYPIPTLQITLSKGNLTQNPGW